MMNSSPQSSPSKQNNAPVYNTITWGLVKENIEIPHAKKIIAYCVIDSDFFATTDGSITAFWKPNQIIKTFSIQATALFYFPKLSQVVAYVRRSSQLHFINIHSPYKIRVHHLHFSESKIYSFFYFSKTSTLVSATDGILFSRVAIPPYFKDAEPMPETLQFEKICLLYEGTKFKYQHNRPTFVETSKFGIVILNINDTIHIYTSNGTLVQIIRNMAISDNISSISLLSFMTSNFLIAGTKGGKVSLLKFELPEPFVPSAPPESCKNIKRYTISKTPIALSELFDRNFLISVDSEHFITIFGVQTESILQKIQCPNEVLDGFFSQERIFLFSKTTVTSYLCSLFLNHFSELGCNCYDIYRASSENRSARIICFLQNNIVTFISPKNGQQILSFTTGANFPPIQALVYLRDIEKDGTVVSQRTSEDILVVQLDQGITSFFQLDHIDRSSYNTVNEAFRSTTKQFDMAWVPTPYTEISLMNQFVAFLDIGNDQVCGIIETGNIYIYSVSSQKMIASYYFNEKDIICATYSFSNNLLIVSCMKKVFTFNLRTREVFSTALDCMITSLLMIDSQTLFCGGANGFVEVRNFPYLQLKSTSLFYNTFHSDNGHRVPLRDTYLSTRQLFENPTCVKKLDFCSRRENVLSLSVCGEIFIWDKTGKPLSRITIPFGASCACFCNGTGSILISSLNLLFHIDWQVLYKKQLLPIQTQLDDFDLRVDSFDMKTVNMRVPPIIQTVSMSERYIFYEDSFMPTLQEPFQELDVEIESFSKRFFAPLKVEEEPIVSTIKKPARSIDDIIEQEKRELEEKNKKKIEAKKLKVKSRKTESTSKPLYTKTSNTKKTVGKYADFYNNDDDDDDGGKSYRSSGKKKGKKKKAKSKKKNTNQPTELHQDETVLNLPASNLNLPSEIESKPENDNDKVGQKSQMNTDLKLEDEKKNIDENTSDYQIHEPNKDQLIHEPNSQLIQSSQNIRNQIQSKAKTQPFITQIASDAISEGSLDQEDNDFHFENNIVNHTEIKPQASTSSVLSTHSSACQRSHKRNNSEASSINGNRDWFNIDINRVYNRYNRVRAFDDTMFSNYKIDGFNKPFGGYAVKAGQGVVPVGVKAQMLKISNAHDIRHQKTKRVLVTKVVKEKKI